MIELIQWTAIIGIGILIVMGLAVAYLFYTVDFADEEYEHESGYVDETKTPH